MNKSAIFITILVILLISYFITDNINQIDKFIIDSGIPGPILLLIAGTHGNEPAGTIGLEKIVNSGIKISKGKIIIIPRVNKIGLFLGTRYGFNGFFPIDYNRNYPNNKEELSGDYINYQIINSLSNADFIVDFHEGWGFSKSEPKSMGSGIYPSNTPIAKNIGNNLLIALNNTIKEQNKEFIIKFDSSKIPNTLDSYANSHNKNYILVETSGQDDIQPINLRVEQVILIINVVLENFNMK